MVFSQQKLFLLQTVTEELTGSRLVCCIIELSHSMNKPYPDDFHQAQIFSFPHFKIQDRTSLLFHSLSHYRSQAYDNSRSHSPIVSSRSSPHLRESPRKIFSPKGPSPGQLMMDILTDCEQEDIKQELSVCPWIRDSLW
jgi:hypothetical protein